MFRNILLGVTFIIISIVIYFGVEILTKEKEEK